MPGLPLARFRVRGRSHWHSVAGPPRQERDSSCGSRGDDHHDDDISSSEQATDGDSADTPLLVGSVVSVTASQGDPAAGPRAGPGVTRRIRQ